jgi:hypothetical protein
MIFTDPKHQRRGAGSMLVKWGVDKADEMGVETCLEATLFGRRVYEKFGFHVTERVVVPVPVPEKWADKPTLGYLIMQRPAVKKSTQNRTQPSTLASCECDCKRPPSPPYLNLTTS